MVDLHARLFDTAILRVSRMFGVDATCRIVPFEGEFDGSVHAGPNAVLNFKREGHHKTNFNLADFTEVMMHPDFWRLGANTPRRGTKKMVRSVLKTRSSGRSQQLIP